MDNIIHWKGSYDPTFEEAWYGIDIIHTEGQFLKQFCPQKKSQNLHWTEVHLEFGSYGGWIWYWQEVSHS